MTSRKKKNTEKSPEPTAKAPEPTTVESSPPDDDVLPDEPPEATATEELLFIAFAAWKFNHFQPLFYRMTRTWAHHKLGETYDTGIIFEHLDHMNQGNHAELLEQINAFGDTLMKELKQHLARKGTTK